MQHRQQQFAECCAAKEAWIDDQVFIHDLSISLPLTLDDFFFSINELCSDAHCYF
jgi:hypothetical protein